MSSSNLDLRLLHEISRALVPKEPRGEIHMTPHDLELLLDALAMAASRREAEARFNWPRPAAKRADERAMAFRELQRRLLRVKAKLAKEPA